MTDVYILGSMLDHCKYLITSLFDVFPHSIYLLVIAPVLPLFMKAIEELFNRFKS